MSSLWRDLKYALRMMVKAPGLTSVLLITLALGIGASTTIFSVVNSVVIKPLPYENPEQLARVYTEFKGQMGLHQFWLSPPEYQDLARECRSCAAVGAWARGTASFSGGDRPMRVDAGYVTHTLLPLLGVQPMLGRYFDTSEDRPGDPSVVILSYDLWRRAFGGDREIIGKRIKVDAMPVTVVGVMPPGFDFLGHLEAWLPANVDYAKANRGGHYFHAVARLAPGATIASFQDELAALSHAWGAHHVDKVHSLSTEGHPMVAAPFQADLVGSLATPLWLLQCAVLFVLLISVVNVANLLLARADARTREIAVRHALGANRRRLVRQFITESLVLGIIGGALGVLVAVWAVDGVTALIPKSAPRANEISLDGHAVAFAVACSIAAAMLFGLAPILHARKTDIHGALKDGSPRMSGSRTRLRVRRALVIAEVALAVVLVVGCTVMVRSFVRLQQVDAGFRPDHLLTFQLELPEKIYPDGASEPFWLKLQDRIRALPGVKDATLISGQPPERTLQANDIGFPGRTRTVWDPVWNVDYWQMTTDRAIETLGAHLVRGRAVPAADTLGAPSVVLVNQAFARKFFRGDVDPIGQRVQLWGEGPEQTIVGIVGDIKNAGIDKPAGTEVWVPVLQYPALDLHAHELTMWTVIRTDGDPGELAPAVQRAVASLDPTLPVSHMRTMNDVVWEAVARPRFLMFLLSSFAGIALLLAAVGIYGVMAHTVAQRTHEIGLRVALGARPSQVRALVLRQAGTLIGIGVAFGLAASVALQAVLGSSLRTVFYGEELSEPVMLGGVAIVVALTALLATWIPVRRATNVQPTVALRSE